jgi:cytoskeletal protein RodZ
MSRTVCKWLETRPRPGRVAGAVHVRHEGESMRNTLTSFAAILLSFSLILPTFAQGQAPKTTDLPAKVAAGPEVQQEKSKAATSPSGRKSKKKDASIDERKGKNSERPPTGIEGPETRKARKEDASAKPQKPKGTEGPDAGKEQKKP